MTLSPEERVRILLALVPYYKERQYTGNYYDNDDLNDILAAYERADLSKKQREAIRLVYLNDLMHKDAAAIMGIGRSTVSEHVDKAVNLIAIEYEKGNSDEFEGF